MRFPDTNVLLYAHNRSAARHRQAAEWMTAVLSGSEPVGFAWPVLVAFIRLSTGVAFATPLSPDQALRLVDGWLAQPSAVILQPTERHAAILRGLIESAEAAGNLTNDAHLAALAIEHGATFASFDADFHRFEDLGLKLEYLH